MDEKELQRLYDAVNSKFEVGGFDSFKAKMQTPEDRKKFYTAVSEKGFDLGEEGQFEERLSGVKKKPSSSVQPSVSEDGSSNTLTPDDIPVVSLEPGKQAHPIDLAAQYNELANATATEEKKKDFDQLRALDPSTEYVTVPDNAARKKAADLKEYLKIESGIEDPEKLYQETKDFPKEAYDIKFQAEDGSLRQPYSKDNLLKLRQENPLYYQKVLSTAKNQFGIAKKTGSWNLANEYVRLNKSDNISQFAGNVKRQQEIIQSVFDTDEDIKKANERLEQAQASSVTPLAKGFKEEYSTSPFSSLVTPEQYAGLKTLELFRPQEYEQAVGLLKKGVAPEYETETGFDIRKGKPFKVTSETQNSIDARQGLETVGKKLLDIGRQNIIMQSQKELANLSAKYKDASPEEQAGLLQEAQPYKDAIDKVHEDAKGDAQKFPLSEQLKFDNQVKELTQDAGTNAFGYAATRFGKGFEATGNTLNDIKTAILGSSADKSKLDAQRLGESNREQSESYLPTSMQAEQPDYTLQFPKELKEQAKNILANGDYSDETKQFKLQELIKNNQGKIESVTNPEAGKHKNFFSKATLYGNAGMIGDIASLAAQSYGLGMAGASRLVTNAAPLFTTSYDSFLKQGIAEGSPHPEGYAATHAMIMALAGTINPKLDIVKKALGNSNLGKQLAGVSEETWNKVVEGNKPLLDKFKNAAGNVLKEGSKMAAVYGAGTSIANDLADKGLFNKDISGEEIINHAVKETKNLLYNSAVLLGAGAVNNFKSTPLHEKAMLWELGDNKDIALQQIKDAAAIGEITPQIAEKRTDIVKNISKIIETVPTERDGKPLTDKQRVEYFYNALVKDKALKEAATAPPDKKEELEHSAKVADFDNNQIVSPKTETQLEARKNAIEKELEPKIDEEGKKTAVSEKEKKELEAELESVQSALTAHENAVKLSERFKSDNKPEQESQPSTVSSEVAAEALSEPQKEKPVAVNSNPALKDIESTKTALEESMSNGQMGKILNKEGIKDIPIADIVENPNDKSFEDAVRKVKAGLGSRTKEPIIVVLKNDGKYHIRDGAHRVAEAMVNGEKNISADVEYDVEFDQSKNLSEAYHKAKAGGSNPELVKAIEEKFPSQQENKPLASEPDTKASIEENEPVQAEEKPLVAAAPIEAGKPAETAAEPPLKEPPPPEKPLIYVEPKRTIFSHRGLQEVATQFGLNDITSRDRVSDLELFRGADETISKWVADGTYSKNMDGLVEKAKAGEIFSPEQNVIMAQHIAQMREKAADVRKRFGINSPEYNEALRGLQNITTIGQKVRSDIGAALRVPKLSRTYTESLDDAMAAKMDAVGTDALTEKQKADVENQFDNIKKERDDFEAKFNAAQAKFTEMQAQNEISSIASKRTSTGKRDFKSQRQSLKEKLKQQYEEYKAAGQKMGIASDGGAESFIISAKMAKTIAEIAKTHVEEVGAKIKEVVAKTLEDVKEFLGDSISEKDIMDVLAGKYNEKKATRSELAANMRDVQSEAKLLNEYERLLQGGEPKDEKRAIVRNKRLTELREQIKGLENLGKEIEGSKDAALKAKADKNKETIAALDKLEREDKVAAAKKRRELEAENAKELSRLKSEYDKEQAEKEKQKKQDEIRLVKELDRQLKYKTPAERAAAQAIENNKKAEAKIKEKIASKDFDEKPKAVTFWQDPSFKKNHPELYKKVLDSYTKKEDAQHDFDVALLKDAESRKNLGQKALGFIAAGANTTKKVVTGIDDSSLFMQTLAAMTSRPLVATKAFKLHGLDAFSKKKFERGLAELHNSPDWDLMQKAGLDVTEPKTLSQEKREEAFSGKTWDISFTVKGKEHKVLETLLSPFERAFTSLGNGMRVIAFRGLAEKYMKEGKTFENDPKLFKDLALMLNTETGRGKQNEYMQKASEFVTKGIWSPRLMASRLNMLGISDAAALVVPGTKGYYNQLHPEVRKEALKTLVKFSTTVIALSSLAAYKFGGKVDNDPTSQTYLDIQFPDGKSYNISGGFSQYIRLIAQTVMGGRSKNGEFEEFSGSKDAGSNALHFMRGKVTPVFGVGVDLLSKKDFAGQPVTLGAEAQKLSIPLSLQSVATDIKRDGLKALFNATLPSFVGITVKDKRDFQQPEGKKKKEKKEKHKKKLKELN